MCIGLPMTVLAVRPGYAQVAGRGACREVRTALIDPPRIGDWLLVHLDSAREAISAERAAEVNAALDLLAAAMGRAGGPHDEPDAGGAALEPGFVLPSTQDAATLAACLDAPTEPGSRP
jgi:hydrogenase expression/formation protein HypC